MGFLLHSFIAWIHAGIVFFGYCWFFLHCSNIYAFNHSSETCGHAVLGFLTNSKCKKINAFNLLLIYDQAFAYSVRKSFLLVYFHVIKIKRASFSLWHLIISLSYLKIFVFLGLFYGQGRGMEEDKPGVFFFFKEKIMCLSQCMLWHIYAQIIFCWSSNSRFLLIASAYGWIHHSFEYDQLDVYDDC